MDIDRIFAIETASEFEACCLETFLFQARHCPVYAEYLRLLRIQAASVKRVEDIPFLPIEFFKTRDIVAAAKPPQIIFTSSGTTGMTTSRHPVIDIGWYERSFRTAFNRFYGRANDWAILALLPAYAEREGSSLIYMVDDLIRQSGHPSSGYFLYNHDELHDTLLRLKADGTPSLLIGVTFALLDFVERYTVDFPQLVVMETGGMKGRRREMIREEVHKRLRAGFNVRAIHSEYGMTELLSQAYSAGEGWFECPPWMKILIRDTHDPFQLLPAGRTGGINVIDLANHYSCAFIATQDLGRLCPDGRFEVLGRFDQSDIRGCNLLVQ